MSDQAVCLWSVRTHGVRPGCVPVVSYDPWCQTRLCACGQLGPMVSEQAVCLWSVRTHGVRPGCVPVVSKDPWCQNRLCACVPVVS